MLTSETRRAPVVFVQLHAQYRGVHVSVLRRLKERHGARLHGFATNIDQIRFYRERVGDLFETLEPADLIYREIERDPDPSIDIVAIGRDHERFLGTTINTLVMNDRHLGRGFALGGPGHPRSRMSRAATYPRVLHAFNTQIGFWRDAIDRWKPDLVIHPGKVGSVAARAANVPVRTLVPARSGNRYYWAQNEFNDTDEIGPALAARRDLPSPAPGQFDAHFGYLQVRSATVRDTGLGRALYLCGRMFAQRLWWTYKGYAKAKGYLWSDEILGVLRNWRDMKETRRLSKTRLADLEGQPFVFFPLQTEPENSLQGASPEYFFQLSAVASIARDLPAGTFLAVKEHMNAIGRRPRDFLRQIAEFRNVVLLDIEEYGHQVVHKAAGTITINSTAGYEAARLGRPVVTFGRHNLHHVLDHVRHVGREEDLRPALAWVFNGAHDTAKMAADGARFGAALDDISFDLESFDFTKPDHLDDRPADMAYAALMRSLDAPIWRGYGVARDARLP